MAKNTFGQWAFIAGFLVALLLWVWPGLLEVSMATLLLFVLGLATGVLNVEKRERRDALLVFIAFPLITGYLSSVTMLSTTLGPILQNLAIFIGGAAVVVVGLSLWEFMRK